MARSAIVYSGIQDRMIPHDSSIGFEFSIPGTERSFSILDERGSIVLRNGQEVFSFIRDSPDRPVTATAFEFNEEIGPELDWVTFISGNVLVGYSEEIDVEGNFFDRMDLYIPFRAEIETQAYFGWLRTSHSIEAELFTIHDWAWNSTPGEPILAGEIPEPAACATIIGVGALLVVFLRRRYFSRGGAGARR